MDPEKEADKKKLLSSMFFPFLLVALLWLIKGSEQLFDFRLFTLGILPQTVKGIPGIVLSPLIHGSLEHLYNNTIPLFVLASSIIYFYREVAAKVIIFSWLMSGLWVWSMGRDSYHIGASGLIYAWATFVFFSGIMSKNRNLFSISMLVIFLYGNMVWWVFPIEEQISWEGHLMGSVAGIILAVYYRKDGPKKVLPDWMLEDDDDETEDDETEETIIHDQLKKDNKE